MSINRAVIVAAGRSSRLYPLTERTPKGLLEVGGEAMLRRSIRILKEQGIDRLAIVVGFERGQLERELAGDGITFIYNPFFAETNDLGSLWFARQWVGGEPFIYLHSDIVYEPGLAMQMLGARPGEGACMLVDADSIDEEAMKVRASPEGLMLESSKEIPLDEAGGEWVGMTIFSRSIVPAMFDTLEEVLAERRFQAYDTEAFTRMAGRGHAFHIEYTNSKPWVEIDFLEDLERARRLF